MSFLILFRTFTVYALFLLSQVHALYMGNPYLPEFPREGVILSKELPVSFKVGYQGSYIYERNLSPEEGASGPIQKREQLSYFVNQAVVTVGAFDRVEGYIGLGAAQFIMKAPIDYSVFSSTSHQNFTWEGGGRALLIFWKSTALGVSAGYQAAYPDLDYITYDDVPGSTANTTMRYSQWQIAVGLSHKLGVLSPYIGGAYSYLKYREKLPEIKDLFGQSSTNKRYKGKKKLILIIGASLTGIEGVNLDIEMKTFAEKSLTGSLNVRF